MVYGLLYVSVSKISRHSALSILVDRPSFFCFIFPGLSQSSLIEFIATWAIYNTVRYFIAFSNFGNSTYQVICLALGISAGLSFLLIFSSFLLAIRNGLIHGFTPTYLTYVRTTMDYLSSFCLIGPAVVNFALLFIWKDSEDPYLNVANRCHFDIDVVWTVSKTLCTNKSPHWAVWLTVSALRLALTLIFIVGPISFI